MAPTSLEPKTYELPKTTGAGSRSCSRGTVRQAHDDQEGAVKRPVAEETPA